jgi:hypothetical protein
MSRIAIENLSGVRALGAGEMQSTAGGRAWRICVKWRRIGPFKFCTKWLNLHLPIPVPLPKPPIPDPGPLGGGPVL